MLSVSRSRLVTVPPTRVWEAYVDFDSWLAWVPHFREVVPLSDGPLAQGYRARIRERFSVVPRVWEVTEFEPGRSFAWRGSLAPGLRLTVDHVATPEAPGTLATLTLRVEGPLAPLVAPVAFALTARTFERSLAALAERLEGTGA